MDFRLPASVVLRLLREDPEGFCIKLSERLRQLGVPGASFLALKYPRDVVHQLAARGELSAALDLISADPIRFGRRGQRLARRLGQQLQELETSPLHGTSPRPADTGSKALYVLTNSLPYTNSGYTQRSHQSLLAMQTAGVSVEAATRLAYPLVIGKRAKQKTELIDNLVYHRLLPERYAATVTERHSEAAALLAELAKKNDVRLLHTTTGFSNAIVVSRAAQSLQIPWIYEIRGEPEKTWLSSLPEDEQHAAESSEYFRLVQQQETRYAAAADAVVVLSEISQAQLIERGIPAEKITVIPNAVDSALVDLPFDRNAIRRELDLPLGKKLVGTVSALVDYEGLDILVQALKELPPEYSLLLVGEGTARPQLQKLVEMEGLEDRVLFAGRKPQRGIWKWYAALEVFVVPRRNTPVCRTVTPIKALTAQALGIPVVASDLPALREVTGNLAHYVPAEDPTQLAKGILCADDGHAGKTWAASRSWGSVGGKYRRLYDDLRAEG